MQAYASSVPQKPVGYPNTIPIPLWRRPPSSSYQASRNDKLKEESNWHDDLCVQQIPVLRQNLMKNPMLYRLIISLKLFIVISRRSISTLTILFNPTTDKDLTKKYSVYRIKYRM